MLKFVFLLTFGCQALHAAPVYKLDHRISMPGDSGWDYINVDDAARRLYLTRGQRVDVMDLDSEKIIASIPGTFGVHGVAIDGPLGKGFSSNGLSSTVTVFDLGTSTPFHNIKVEQGPDCILYDAPLGLIFTFNGKGHSASAIDARTEKVRANIPLGAKPEFGVSDGQGGVFVDLEDKDAIAAIDAKALKVSAIWPLKAKGPTGLAVDPDHGLLFAACQGGKMEVVDAKSGSVTAEIPIGAHPDAAAFDPGTQLAFASCGDGTLSIAKEVSPSAFTVLDSVVTQKGARTMALDPSTHSIYLLCARYLTESAQVAGEKHRPSIEPGSVELLVLKKL